jgi:shikimate kinase
MMGAGKSSVGDCLAWRTKLALHDTDEIIGSNLGMSVPEIFAKHGEEKFREAETRTLRNLTKTKQAIIVTGGGIVLRGENVDLLKRLGVVVWLDGNEEALFKRASQWGNRPLLQGKNPRKAFVQILQAREQHYANVADLRVDTSVFTEDEVAIAILSKLRRRYNRKPKSPVRAA